MKSTPHRLLCFLLKKGYGRGKSLEILIKMKCHLLVENKKEQAEITVGLIKSFSNPAFTYAFVQKCGVEMLL
jgi:hypothetical protein